MAKLHNEIRIIRRTRYPNTLAVIYSDSRSINIIGMGTNYVSVALEYCFASVLNLLSDIREPHEEYMGVVMLCTRRGHARMNI